MDIGGCLADGFRATASAQEVATSFEQLRSFVKPGDTIYVTGASGHQTKGTLGELSTTSLELLIGNGKSD